MGSCGFFRHLLNFLFPPFCLVCGSRTADENNLLICDDCFRGITLISRPSCIRCGRPFLTAEGDDHVCGACLHSKSTITSVKALGVYDETLRRLIHLIKYKGRFAAVSVLRGLLEGQAAVERERLPRLETDEYYWSDLEGLRVRTLEGVELGVISHLFDTGANDVIVVAGERERLIPYLWQRVVKQVDLKAGLMLVDWDPDF